MAVPDAFRAFDDAQRRAIALTSDVLARLEGGMSERDIYELCETRLPNFGFKGWYHTPEVRIRPHGPAGTLKRPDPKRTLNPGDLLSIDVGPYDGQAYGDFGTSLCFASPDTEPQLLGVARECVRATCGYASRWKTVGELVIFAQAWAVNNRMTLASKDTVGHRILTRDGAVSLGFPKSAHAATLLRRNQVYRLNPARLSGMFAIRPEVVHHDHRASFEEIVYIDGDQRGVLGRDKLSDAGT